MNENLFWEIVCNLVRWDGEIVHVQPVPKLQITERNSFVICFDINISLRLNNFYQIPLTAGTYFICKESSMLTVRQVLR